MSGPSKHTSLALLLATTVASVGCAAIPPPKELVEARASYDRAQGGIARTLAPAALDTAKQSLQKAERSFRDDGDEIDTRAFAYIAERKARLSEAVAGMEQALAERLALEKKLKQLQEEELAKARDALRNEKDRLEAEKRAREEAERARLKAEQDKASADKARLEAEKARAEAERIAAAALASLKEMASVKEEQRGVVITLSGAVLFASGKSELLPIAKEKLNDVAKVLKEQKNPPLRIEGHTDSTGSADENRKLSLARAEAVKAHLVSQGYPDSKIRAVGLGPDRPVADNGSPEGRANNRRVEIIVNPRD